MNTPTRTRPGHWADVPTAAQVEADQQDNRGARIACLGVVGLIFLIVLVVWSVRYFLKG